MTFLNTLVNYCKLDGFGVALNHYDAYSYVS